ncbi:MAG: DUF2807 domain-containing protein [Candidatus Portnoybacteria bacterium]|nr:DUF2807 domain-containing protein [Candidatus Portnoybacteria bacterium]
MENTEQNPQQKTENQEQKQEQKPEQKESIREVHHHHYHKDKHGFNFGKFLIGLIIIFIGLAYLGAAAGWVDFEVKWNWDYFWPLLIIIIGLSFISFKGWLGALFGILATFVVLALIIFLVFGSQGASPIFGEFISGSGNVITEEREVADFDKIYLSGLGNLIIEQGDKESLKIEAEDNIIPKISTRVSDKALEIKYERFWPWFFIKPQKQVNFYITVKDINKVSISGSGSVSAANLKTNSLEVLITGSGKANLNVEAENLKSTISGSGDFSLSGKATNQEISISGSGNYEAKNLESKKADIKISGAGKAQIRVQEKLDITISGSGEVSYIGNPQIDQKISGSGKVLKLNE